MEVKSTKMQNPGLCQNLAAFSQNTTLHGISHISQSKTKVIQRLAWTAIFLGAVTLFLYFIVTSTIRFFSYPIVSTLEFQYVESLELPSVTICNDKSHIPSFLSSSDNVEYASGSGRDEYMYDSNNNMLNFPNQTAFQYSNMVIECNISKFGTCPHESHFTDMGYCHTVNPRSFIMKNGAVTTSSVGQLTGIWVYLDVQMSEGSNYLLVHPHDEEPIVSEAGTSMYEEDSIDIILKQTDVYNLQQPYGTSDCMDTNNPSFINPLKLFSSYSLSACKLECL